MKITRAFILENRSANGGWNFSQIAMLGESWPPSRGWINRAVGREISEEDAARFIAYGQKRPRKEERKAVKAEAKARRAKVKKQMTFSRADGFLATYEWRQVRMQVLKRDGAKCACCGATPADGLVMNVDHIKPRKLYPELALDPSNLQVLCSVCNHGKGNWDETDWRKEYSESSIGAKLRIIK
jgi:5-methylcytosine-specific restriction endonuclease McrA